MAIARFVFFFCVCSVLKEYGKHTHTQKYHWFSKSSFELCLNCAVCNVPYSSVCAHFIIATFLTKRMPFAITNNNNNSNNRTLKRRNRPFISNSIWAYRHHVCFFFLLFMLFRVSLIRCFVFCIIIYKNGIELFVLRLRTFTVMHTHTHTWTMANEFNFIRWPLTRWHCSLLIEWGI